MGIYKRGVLGGFSGKIGTVIGSTWNGIEYMRSLPKASSRPATLAQMTQGKLADFRPLPGIADCGAPGNSASSQ